MRGRYGRYAVPASAVTAMFSIACRKLSKTQLAFSLHPSDYVRSPFSSPSPVPSPTHLPAHLYGRRGEATRREETCGAIPTAAGGER